MRRFSSSPMRSSGLDPESRIRVGRSARSSSWALPGSGRPSRQESCGCPVRHRRKHGPHRHERIPGAAHGESAGRRSTGYIGYEEVANSPKVRRKPYSVILLDEIEKAHVDVFNTAAVDDGRLTDSHGRTVDFRNTVVIMTSNIGSEFLMQGVTAEGEIKEGCAPPGAGCLAQPLPAGVLEPG